MNKRIIVILVVLFSIFSTSCNSKLQESVVLQDTPNSDQKPPTANEVTGANQEKAATTQSPSIENKTTQPYKVVYEEQFKIWDPFTEVLTDELLKQIGAYGFKGSDEQIAQQIFKWQQENMVYIGDTGQQMDVSYQGRWNLFMPGIYPASELLVEHVNDKGKIYGICSDYSLIFCAIANSYGLETRNNIFTKYKFSEVNKWVDPETTRGLALLEYQALNEKLTKHGVNLTYGQIDRVARESYVHARPEVKINGDWVSFDGAGIIPTGDYLIKENYEALPYYADYNNVMLYAPVTFENDQINLENLAELLSYWPQLDYEGITDDAGNKNRAAKFIDLARGLGLVPYFKDLNVAIEFLKIDADNAKLILEETPEIMKKYEGDTGKLFYTIADILIYDGEEDIESSKYVSLYNSITGSNLTEEEFNEYMK